jgi:hypothetical protein
MADGGGQKKNDMIRSLVLLPSAIRHLPSAI